MGFLPKKSQAQEIMLWSAKGGTRDRSVKGGRKIGL